MPRPALLTVTVYINVLEISKEKLEKPFLLKEINAYDYIPPQFKLLRRPSWTVKVFVAFSGKNIKKPDIYLQNIRIRSKSGKDKIFLLSDDKN